MQSEVVFNIPCRTWLIRSIVYYKNKIQLPTITMTKFISGATPAYQAKVHALGPYSWDFRKTIDELGMTEEVSGFQYRTQQLLDSAKANIHQLQRLVKLGDAHTQKLIATIGTSVTKTINPYSFPGTQLAIDASNQIANLELAFVQRMRVIPETTMNQEIR